MDFARLFGPYTEVVNESGKVRPYGIPFTGAPITLTLTGEKHDTQTIVADNFTKVTLWQNGDSGVDTFQLLMFETDEDVLLELVIDRAGTPTFSTIEVVSNSPLRLTSDDMVNAVLTNGTVTTLDQVDEINCKRNVADDVGDASVSLTLWV